MSTCSISTLPVAQRNFAALLTGGASEVTLKRMGLDYLSRFLLDLLFYTSIIFFLPRE